MRFSSKRQEKGASKDRQLELGHALCERKGWRVADVIEDLGYSAWAGDHLKVGNLGKFKARVDAGEIPAGSVLVVENLDRLSRQEPKKARRWMEDVTEAGVLIATSAKERIYNSDSFNGNNVVEILEVLIDAQRANMESSYKSDRIKDAWSRRRSRAASLENIGGRIPAWLEIGPDGKFEVIDEDKPTDRGAVIRRIYQDAINGYGKWAIAARLNEAGIKPWGRPLRGRLNRGWEWSYVHALLKDPRVEGEYRPKVMVNGKKVDTGEVIADYFPRIVDADTVARARAAVASRRGTGGKQRLFVGNLFSTATQCRACGGPMHLRNIGTHGGPYLQCANARHKRGCPHTKPLYHYPRFETAALDHVLELALDGSHFTRPDGVKKLAVHLAEVEKAVQMKQAEAANLAMALGVVKDPSTIPSVVARIAAVEQEIKALTKDRDDAANQLAEAKGRVSPAEHAKRVASLRVLLDDDDVEVRREARLTVQSALSNVIDKVVCDPSDTTLTLRFRDSHTVVFNNDGEIIDERDNVGSELADLLSSEHPGDQEKVKEYLRQVVADPVAVQNVLGLLRRKSRHRYSEAYWRRADEYRRLLESYSGYAAEYEIPPDQREEIEAWIAAGRPPRTILPDTADDAELATAGHAAEVQRK